MGKVKKVSIIYLIHAYNIILYSRKLWRGLIWQFGEFGKDSQIKNLPIIIDYMPMTLRIQITKFTVDFMYNVMYIATEFRKRQ